MAKSMNVSSKWKTSTISCYIVVDFVCNDMLNRKIEEIHFTHTSNEKNSNICAAMSAHEQHPPALSKVSDIEGLTHQNDFIKIWKAMLQA